MEVSPGQTVDSCGLKTLKKLEPHGPDADVFLEMHLWPADLWAPVFKRKQRQIDGGAATETYQGVEKTPKTIQALRLCEKIPRQNAVKECQHQQAAA